MNPVLADAKIVTSRGIRVRGVSRCTLPSMKPSAFRAETNLNLRWSADWIPASALRSFSCETSSSAPENDKYETLPKNMFHMVLGNNDEYHI